MKELKDTIELMNSEDFKDRVRAEYYQLQIRHEGSYAHAGDPVAKNIKFS